MSARAYACPSCGAQVDEQSRRCRYCDAPVATVRCASCFHMNVPDAGYCSGCGSQLGLEPVGLAGELPCPVCKKPLEVYREGAGNEDPSASEPAGHDGGSAPMPAGHDGGSAPMPPGTLLDCGTCGGQFVEHAMLRQLIERHARPLPSEAPPPRSTGHGEARAAYVPCPACAALMNRKNFGGTSGVIVDVCKKHGTWFDLGALPRVLAFVSAGGLERAHQRDMEDEARARREARAAAAAVVIPPPIAGGEASLAAEAGARLAEMLVDLLLR